MKYNNFPNRNEKIEKENLIDKIFSNFQKNQYNSFNQFKNIEGFFYYEDSFEQINRKWDKIIDNIYKTFILYTSKIIKPKISIIQSEDKIQIIFKSVDKNVNKEMLHSIFNPIFCSIQNFIEGSYSNYIELKKEIDIDLLLMYYAWFRNGAYIET